MDLPDVLASWFGLTGAEQQQAAITGLFQMVGLLVTGIAAIVTFVLTQIATRRRDDRLYNANIRRDETRRIERMRDLQIALRAEIRIFASKYVGFDFDSHRDAIVSQMQGTDAAGRNFTPFVPKTTDMFIWSAVSEDIPILPARVIEPVILYYDMLRALGLLVDDMRSSAYAALEPSRKAAVYEGYVEMLRKLAYHAEHALSALDDALEAGRGQ